jgi:hypothetical protein
MRVLLPVYGSRGDVGPAAGFAVAMATSDPDRS